MKKPLWKPSKSRLEESNLYNFYNFLVSKDGLDFKNNYEELWNWSIKESFNFWPKLIDFLDIKTGGSHQLNIDFKDKIYDQSFFPNLEINYAENIGVEPFLFVGEIIKAKNWVYCVG